MFTWHFSAACCVALAAVANTGAWCGLTHTHTSCCGFRVASLARSTIRQRTTLLPAACGLLAVGWSGVAAVSDDDGVTWAAGGGGWSGHGCYRHSGCRMVLPPHSTCVQSPETASRRCGTLVCVWLWLCEQRMTLTHDALRRHSPCSLSWTFGLPASPACQCDWCGRCAYVCFRFR